MANTTARPTLLQKPGYLFSADLGSAMPSFTVVGSKFTDAWPIAWRNLGATVDGTTLAYSTKIEPTSVAEFFDPITYSTTERSGSFAFALADWTLTNMKLAFNGGALTVVSGTGATQLNKLSLPAPGQEVRKMIGWESEDATVRAIAYQCIQGGEIKLEFKKAPATAAIACVFNFEVDPTLQVPFDMWTAGVTRA
jgi:hypothetical protein